jgi:hypothetical protein
MFCQTVSITRDTSFYRFGVKISKYVGGHFLADYLSSAMPPEVQRVDAGGWRPRPRYDRRGGGVFIIYPVVHRSTEMSPLYVPVISYSTLNVTVVHYSTLMSPL